MKQIDTILKITLEKKNTVRGIRNTDLISLLLNRSRPILNIKIFFIRYLMNSLST